MTTNDKRIHNEIEHGLKIASNPEFYWGWSTQAGKKRWSRRVQMLCSPLTENSKVLEIGCGSGMLTKYLQKLNIHLTSIDISEDLINLAKEKVSNPQVQFMVCNAYDLPFEANSFDAIVGSSVLHHLDTHKALENFLRVLKPGGSLTFTEPNMLNPQIALQKNVPYLKEKAGDSPDETAFFKWGIKAKLKRHGFSEVTATPFDFLHPHTPARFIGLIEKLCCLLERIPLLKEIAGSLYIRARKRP